MKILFLSLALLSFIPELYSNSDYSEIDKKSVSVPDSLRTAEQISSYLTKDLICEKDKVRAFYIWISHNIQYDLDEKRAERRYKSKTEIINDVLERRRGVCQHYSELFQAFCQNSGIKSYIITGYTRQEAGLIPNATHAWNAVLIDSNYYNIDVTWSSGCTINNIYVNKFRDKYFLIEPKIFIKSHFPYDPAYQFLDNPINILDFNNQNYLKLLTKGNYNYRAIIKEIETQDKLTYLKQLNKRLVSTEDIDLVLKELNEIGLLIANEKCRIGIDSFNYAIDCYNLYVTNKNARFRSPHISDQQVKDLYTNIERPLFKADLMFQSIFTFDSDLNKQVVDFKQVIQLFESKLFVEKEFVDTYIKTAKPFRFLLFSN